MLARSFLLKKGQLHILFLFELEVFIELKLRLESFRQQLRPGKRGSGLPAPTFG